MKILEIKLSNEIFGVLSIIAKQQDEFVIEAIKEKIEREKKQSLLVEGYQGTFQEDLALAKDFETVKPKRPREGWNELFKQAMAEEIDDEDFEW